MRVYAYNILEVWTLIVAVATLIVAIMTFCFTRMSKTDHIVNLIVRKQARLKAMEESLRNEIDASAAAHLRAEVAALRAEIKVLKSQL